MKNIFNRKRDITIGPILVLIMLVIIPLSNNVVQKILLMLATGGYFLIIIKNRKIIALDNVYKLFVPALLWTCWSLFVGVKYIGGVDRIIQGCSIIIIVLATSMFSKNDFLSSINLMKIIAFTYVFSWVVWIPIERNLNEYRAYFKNSNTFAAMALNMAIIFMVVPFKKRSNRILMLLLTAGLVIISGSRSTILAMTIFFFVYALCKGLKQKKWLLFNEKMIFWISIVFSGIVSYMYPALYGTIIGDKLNLLSREIFNKNFFSGRQIVWAAIINAINESPITGYGLDATPGDFLNTTLSSHNLYLQTLLQCGWVGLIFFVFMLWSFFVRCANISSKISTVTTCFIIAIIYRECFEVTLTQNNWPQGFFLWVMIGLSMRSKTVNI